MCIYNNCILNFIQFISVSQVSSGSTRQHTESLTVTRSPTAGTQPDVHQDKEKRDKPGWGETLAKLFPVVRLVQVQVG